jgi:hypothetical protein
VCAPATQRAETSLDYFQVKDDQNRLYPVWAVDAADVKTPFPTRVTLEPGDCVRGWIPFTIPADLTVAAVHYSPDGNARNQLIWKIQ